MSWIPHSWVYEYDSIVKMKKLYLYKNSAMNFQWQRMVIFGILWNAELEIKWSFYDSFAKG